MKPREFTFQDKKLRLIAYWADNGLPVTDTFHLKDGDGIILREVLPEPPKVDEDFDQAVDKYWSWLACDATFLEIEAAAKFGAEWQKDKDAKQIIKVEADSVRANFKWALQKVELQDKVRESTMMEVCEWLRLNSTITLGDEADVFMDSSDWAIEIETKFPTKHKEKK